MQPKTPKTELYLAENQIQAKNIKILCTTPVEKAHQTTTNQEQAK